MDSEKKPKSTLKMSINLGTLSGSSEDDSSQGSRGKESTDELLELGEEGIYLASPRDSKLASPHTPPSLGRHSPVTRLLPLGSPQAQRSRTNSSASRPMTSRARSSRSFIGTARRREGSQVAQPKRIRLDEDAFSPRDVLRSFLGGSKEHLQSERENEKYKVGAQKLQEVLDKVKSWAPERKKAQLEKALENFLEAKQKGHSFASIKVGEIYTQLGLLLLPEALRDPSSFLNLSQLPEGIQPDVLIDALEFFKKASEEGDIFDEDLDDPYFNPFQFQGNFEGKLYYAKFCYLIGEFYRQQMLSSSERAEQEELKRKAKEYFFYAKAGHFAEAHEAEARLSFPNPLIEVWWLRSEDPKAPDSKKLERARAKQTKKQKLSDDDEKVLKAHVLFETANRDPSNEAYRQAVQLFSGLQTPKKKMNAEQIQGGFAAVFSLLNQTMEDGHPLAAITLGEAHTQYGVWLLPPSFRGATPPQNIIDMTPLIEGISTTDIDAAFRQFNLAFRYGNDLGRRWYVALCYMKGVLHNQQTETSKAEDCFFKAAKLNHQLAQSVCFLNLKEMGGAESYRQGNDCFENAVNAHDSFKVSRIKEELLEILELLQVANREGCAKSERKMGEVNRHLGLLCLSTSLRNTEKLSDLREPFCEETALEALVYFERAMKEGDHEGTQRYAWLSTILGEFYQQRYQQSVHSKKKSTKEESSDLTTARKYFATSARLGNPNGQYAYACLLEKGEEKVKWLRKAAKAGNTAAIKDVAEVLESKNKYPLEVAKWHKKLKKIMPNAIVAPLSEVRLGYAEAEYSNALKMLSKGNFEDAAGLLSLFSTEGHTPSSYALMFCYGQLEQEENLLTVYQRLADQGEEEGLCLYAKRLESEDPTRAKAFYIDAIQSQYPLAFFDFAQFLANQKRLKEAITFFRELTHHIESYAIRAHELLISSLEKQNKLAEAQQWREGLLKIKSEQVVEYLGSFDNPSEEGLGPSGMAIMFKLPPLCFYDMQRAFLKKKDGEKGLFFFRKFLNSLRDFSALAHFNMGLLHEAQRNISTALSDFEAAGKLGFSEALFVHALYYVQGGKRSTAKEQLEKVVKKEEEATDKSGEVSEVMQEAALELAFMAQEEGDSTIAEEWYCFILKKDPKSTRALINLGLLLHASKPMEEEQLFTKAADLKDSKALSLLGDIYVQRGDVLKGKSYYEKAAGLGRASAAYKLARLTKDHNEALSWDSRAAHLGKLESMIYVSEYNQSLGNNELASVWEHKALQQKGGKKKLALSLVKRKERESRSRGYEMLLEVDPNRLDPSISCAIAEHKIKEGKNVKDEVRILIEFALLGYQDVISKLYQVATDLSDEGVTEKSPHLYAEYGDSSLNQAILIFKLIAEDIKNVPREIQLEAMYQCGKLLSSTDPRRAQKYIQQAAEMGNDGAKSFLEKK